MSALTDLIDRLSGVAIVKERLADTSKNVDHALIWLLDHEKRLVRLEAGHPPGKPKTPAPARRSGGSGR